MGLLKLIRGTGGRKQAQKAFQNQNQLQHQHQQQQNTSDYTFRVILDSHETIEEVQHALRTAGLESSQLILGFDFTKSNEWTGKYSFNGQCLHTVGTGVTNPYEHAASIIAQTLSAFDDDNLIPCYGFGDATTGDCRVFSFFPNDQPAQGLQSVLERYRQLAPYVQLAGPTSFAPLIRQAIRIVANSGMQYHILVIVADGQVTPTCLQDTVSAIFEASFYPLSIIMVGVGDGPWDTMVAFDDALPARSFDNFQFVNFSQRMNEASVYGANYNKIAAHFALHALMEIPEQYRAVLALKLLGQTARQPQMGNYGELVLPPPVQALQADVFAYRSGANPGTPFFPGGTFLPRV